MKKDKTKGNSFVPEFDTEKGILKTGGIAIPVIQKVKDDGTSESFEEACQRTQHEATVELIMKPLTSDKKFVKELLQWADTGAKSEGEIMTKFNQCMRAPEKSVSDECFFETIRENPLFLAARFAMEKIARWRKEIYDNDKNKAREAQNNLQKIGNALAYKGHHRAKTLPAHVKCEWEKIYALVKYKGICKMRNDANKKVTLKEFFGNQIIDKIKSIPTTYSKLADCITAQFFNLKPSAVEQYRKGVKKIELTKGQPAYISKDRIKSV